MKSLISVSARYCNLGLEEVYKDDLENDGRNPDRDSLSCLNGKTNLNYLDVTGNLNLKWINYISDLSQKMRTFYASGCENLVGQSVREISKIILSSTSWSLPDRYRIFLSSDERIDYLNLNLSDNSNEFLALQNNLELKALRLDRES